MIPDVQTLVKVICPDMPEDKVVKAARDQTMWYKVHSGCLIIPPVKMLETNLMLMDKTVEAVLSFKQYKADAPRYQWDNLKLRSIHTAEDIRMLHKHILNSGGIVAVDIETRRVEWEDNKVLSIGFCCNNDEAWALWNIDWFDENVREALQQLFSDPVIIFIWHNGKFDTGRLKYLININARVDEDTMLQHYVQINEKKGTHGLKTLGPLYLHAPDWDEELNQYKNTWCRQHKIKVSDFMYDYIPLEILIPYMQRDCIATFRLHFLFKNLAREGSDYIYRVLIKASNVYREVELNGCYIDVNYLEDLEFELENALYDAQKHLQEISSKIWNPLEYAQNTGAKASLKDEFNPKSPKQLKWMLQQVTGYSVDSTDAATIDKLMEFVDNGTIVAPMAKEFLESMLTVRKFGKYMDTYVQGMREGLCRDMRIRGTFNLHGTETGRLSSSNPNMQNIPRDKKIKNLFSAPEGYTLLQLDYSQAEFRVLAILSQDPYMIKSYQEGIDFHDAVATAMFGPNFDKEQRVLAKTINFGIAYGRGPGSIAQKFHMSMNEARSFIARWYEPMPGVKAYIDGQRSKPLKNEECTTPMGRMRHFIITDAEMNHIQNEYINTPIQSLASDFTMLSLIHIHEWLQKEGIDAKIVSTVHDSILIEVVDDKKIIDKVATKCIDIMATTPQQYVDTQGVPFKADAEYGKSWGLLKEWEPDAD